MMVQSYTTECKNANTSIKKVGFKASNKSQRPVLTSDCDIRQIYKIIANSSPKTPPNTEFKQLREYSRLYYHTLDNNPDPRAKKYAQFLKQQINDLKQKLPVVIFSANTTRHNKQAVTEAFNGVIQSDIDFHYWNGDKDAERIKDRLKTDPYILGAFISPSGYGLKIQIHTDNAADQYTATRDAFNRYLSNQYDIQPTVKKYGREIKVIDVLEISKTCYLSYDPDIYTNLSAAAFNEMYQAPQPKRTAHTATTTPPSEAKNIIESIIKEVERQQIDITLTYERWYRIGLAIAHHFGEPGRVYFHDISKYYPGYRISATDNQYSSYLRAATPGAPVTIATVIKYAQEYGIKVKSTGIEVVNPDQIIKVDQYVSEATADILQAIQEHEKIAIVSATSTGKTRGFFEHILPQIEGKHIVALPYVANVKQAERRYECGALYGSLDFIDYSTAYQNKIIATTYDQAARLPGDTLIIDEAHNLAGQYNFRPDAIQAIEAAQRDKKRVILITATPSPMFQMEGFHVLQIEPKEKPQQRVKLRPYSDKKQTADIVYQEAQKAITANEKALIKCNDKDLLQHVAEKLKRENPGKDIATLYRDLKDPNSTNDTGQAISEGKFPFDVLLCTSIINDGVSIDKTFVHRVISVENQYKPIPKNLVQFIARPRQDVEKIKYICYYLQAKNPNKKRRAKPVTSLYQGIKDSNARRCKDINDTLQPGEDPTDGDNLSHIGNFKSQITLNKNTGMFEPSTFAAMYDAEQIYRNTLNLEAFTATIAANYPYITIEVDNQYSIDPDKDLQQELQKDKDQDREDQRQIYKLIKEGKQDQILEYVCKTSTDFKVIKTIQEYQGIDKRYKLSNEARELYSENKNLFKRSYNSIERISLRLCTCIRYGIKNAENIIFNDDQVIRHGKSFKDIITSIEAQILTTCSAEDLNRLSKRDQKIIFKILQTVLLIKAPLTQKQIHKKILDAIGSNEPYFSDEYRTMNIVKTFFNLQRYQADKSKRYYTIGDRVSLDQFTENLHISVNYRYVKTKTVNYLNDSTQVRTPKHSYI